MKKPIRPRETSGDVAGFLRSSSAPAIGYPDVPFSADVRAGKGTAFYRAHTYHTKVPPQGIEAFIAHYTQPGHVVLDPFCGSGMTGIAAIRQGRRAMLSDLSPAAAFFASNHCRPLDVAAFLAAGGKILQAVERDYGWLYATADRDTGRPLQFDKMLWSLALRCPACRKRYSLWEAALDERRQVLEEYPCPHCRATITKKSSRRDGWLPVRVDYGGHSKNEAPLGRADRALIAKIGKLPWPVDLWHPTTPIPQQADEIARLHNDGIATVAELFTRRNLLCIAALWREAGRADESLRQALMFAVTGIMQRASRLNKFIPSLNMCPGPILGTMYIPGFYPEMNAFRLFERKLAAIAKSHRELRPPSSRQRSLMDGSPAPDTNSQPDACVLTRSATDLSHIPDCSIDYVFTDPPFGSNIQYSELNLLWESWLGTLTDASQEAVMNRTQGKDVHAYGGLMARAFSEMHRVLRPDAWLTLVFHNSSGEVWAAIQQGLAGAGFAIKSITTFDKAHDTFKMVTAPGAVGYDVVVNCRKCSAPVPVQAGEPATLDDAREFVRKFLSACNAQAGVQSNGQTSARLLHSRAIAHFMAQGRPIAFDFREFRAVVEDER
ncbi:MAG TPA: DNA methyltransferase [Planctomycetota bacterium]|nr:DNA methyltransferase [Planctomycetota bacterium]